MLRKQFRDFKEGEYVMLFVDGAICQGRVEQKLKGSYIVAYTARTPSTYVETRSQFTSNDVWEYLR